MAANDRKVDLSLEVVYQDLLAEHKACQKQLHSKDEALKIFQAQLKDSNLQKQHLKQEIKQLHSQLARSQMLASLPILRSDPSNHSPAPQPTDSPIRVTSGVRVDLYDTERERSIKELEEVIERNSELSRQINILEDENEELAGERDYYSGKCTSLVKCLEEERQLKPPSHSVLQTVMEENRQLRLELVEVQAERDQALSRIERYKKAVERRKAKEVNADKVVVSPPSNKKHDVQSLLRRIDELETIGNSLSESVKEKTIALAHQKRANKMLASRITELEHRLKVLEISGLWSGSDQEIPFPADPLLSPDRISKTDSKITSPNSLFNQESLQKLHTDETKLE